MSALAPTHASAGLACRLQAFGLDVMADFRLPGACVEAPVRPLPRLELRRVPRAELIDYEAVPRYMRHLTVFDDYAFAMLESEAGDILFQYGRNALFHLSDDRRLLSCAVDDLADRRWQRVLLDTVLLTVSVLNGYELLHASAVETQAGVVAFSTESGGGKSTLAAECIRRGARFFCDDVLALEEEEGVLCVHPGPPLMNLPVSVPPDRLGEVETLAVFGEERWVRVGRTATEPRRLAAVVLLDRRQGAAGECVRIPATNLDLMRHALGYQHLPGRMEAAFHVLGVAVDTAPVFRLSVEPSMPAWELVDLLESQVEIS